MALRAFLGTSVAALALVIVASLQPVEGAVAAYNISGEWTIGGCTAVITQTYGTSTHDNISIALDCGVTPNKFVGTINKASGHFYADVGNPPSAALDGTLDSSGHQISGTAYSITTGAPQSFPFTGTGGDGDPKPAAPTEAETSTPTTTATTTPAPSTTPTPTPAAVGGLALDAPANGDGAFEAWWLAAMAGAVPMTLGGAVYARKKG